ncbi:MAG: MMPL family transporter [Deltaproteobacteria bacterium]|nr:MMPL family transporter [Deltaproteobacteria bacterium]MBW2116441.1 MMPL family transporter [Deltaproteobacteria bacterium]MBW2343054.1 MMPL family transporter [Deltaproteobacteria bacterium]
MGPKKNHINLPLLIFILLLVTGLFAIGISRMRIDTDIVTSLPDDDSVISDAKYLIMNNPIQDQLVIDISVSKADPDLLVEGGQFIEGELRKSGLFKSVGINEVRGLFPELLYHIINNLPVMFTEQELFEKVGPLLEPRRIRKKLEQDLSTLLGIEGIGRAETVSRDPLSLRYIAMARLADLAPSRNAKVYRGQILSKDGGHLLIMARPKSSGTDTTFSRMATGLIKNVTGALNKKYETKGHVFSVNPVGAYRAALDNEQMAKRDSQRAILFSTLGIALLLLLAFPRPLIGLLSFLPALIGTLIAFFVYSLMHQSISILTLGFGGAIISITVDHGIAYLLFIDRPHETFGRQAAREVRAVGLLATLTTVGAFSVLSISGFPILAQIGQFAALGITFSFVFVHTVFPYVFPVMPPARRQRRLPVQAVVNRLALTGGKKKAYAALALTLFMVYFAKPEFHVDLKAMNTITEETKAAEALVTSVWGNVFSKIFLVLEGKSIEDLQRTGDRLAGLLEQEVASGSLSSAFIPSMIFPGQERGKENFRAWKAFWNRGRISEFKKSMDKASSDLGFVPNAFAPFYSAIDAQNHDTKDIPEAFFALFGIARSRDGSGWVQFSTLTPGANYDGEAFYANYGAKGIARIFDPNLFSERLGRHLSSTFQKMALIIGLSAVILLFLFFMDIRLTLITLLPIIFSLICTLGTLKLIGHPLDIPGLMLSIVVIGMGIDYSIFFVRSYQRYVYENNESLGLIRVAVFMAGASTIIGFGALSFADHSMLKSAGLTSLLGICYSLIGAFAILPPILKTLFVPAQFLARTTIGAEKNPANVVKKYRHMEASPRLSARFRTIFDPMFVELQRFLKTPEIIMDIGSGYGVPAVWILELFPEARVYGIEPDYEKTRISDRVVGERGSIKQDSAPDLPAVPDPADAALMIDVIQYLTDDQLNLTLRRLCRQLRSEGLIIIRARVPFEKGTGLPGLIEDIRSRIFNTKLHYRSVHEIRTRLIEAGFEIQSVEPSGRGQTKTWFLAQIEKGSSQESVGNNLCLKEKTS